MRFLKLCFVLMVVGSGLHAQEKDTCFYHVSFYKWEWNYCFGRDTLSLYDLNLNIIGDTIAMYPDNHPQKFILKYPFKESFDSSSLKVTSYDGTVNCEVLSFTVDVSASQENGIHTRFSGNDLPGYAATKLNNCKPKDKILISDIKIFDPTLKRIILIGGINIYVE